MDETIYTLVLSDGSTIENLTKNGNNYISKTALTEDVFDGKLFSVTEKSVDGELEMTNLELVQITEDQGECWFVLRELSPVEIQLVQMSSDIDFLAMMQDVDL